MADGVLDLAQARSGKVARALNSMSVGDIRHLVAEMEAELRPQGRVCPTCGRRLINAFVEDGKTTFFCVSCEGAQKVSNFWRRRAAE